MTKPLEKIAEKNIIECIDKIVTNSFLMLLFDSLTMKYHPSLKDILKESDIKCVYEFYIELTNNLRQVVDGTGKTREDCLRKCYEFKGLLAEVYEVVKIYLSACGIIDLFIDNYVGAAKYDADTDFSEAGALLKASVKAFMDKAHELDVEEHAAAILLTVLPNYFDDNELLSYILNSASFYFRNTPRDEATKHVRMLKRNYAPVRMNGFGQYFKKYAAKISDIFETIQLTDTDFDLERLGSEYENLYTKIDEIAETISSLYMSLSYISIILSSMYNFNDIIKDNKYYIELYIKTLEIMKKNQDYDLVAEATLDSIDKCIETEMTELVELTKRKELIYKNVSIENFSESTKTLFSVEFYLTAAFYENLEEVVDGVSHLTFDDAFATKIVGKKELKSLELFIKESGLGMGEILKTCARRNLFLCSPFATFYGREKILEYVDLMLSKPVTHYEVESCLVTVNKLLDEKILSKLENMDIY